MATEDKGSAASKTDSPGQAAVTPAKKRRLDQQFEHGKKLESQKDFDYAAEMFSHCIVGYPASLEYLQSLLATLKRKHRDEKKGKPNKSKAAKARNAAKKALGQQDWNGALKLGLEALRSNLFDVPALTTLATAVGNLGGDECQLLYLRTALDATPKDLSLIKLCAETLVERGFYDQAISCWQRADKVKPNDPAITKKISDLVSKKTMEQGGYENARSSQQVRVYHNSKPAASEELSSEEQLREDIEQDPSELSNYVELSQLLVEEGKLQQADDLLATAFEVSDADPEIRLLWDEVQLRRARTELLELKLKAEANGDPAAEQRFRQLVQEFSHKESEFFIARCKQHPDNMTFRFDLGLRLQSLGRYEQAIEQLRLASQDPQRTGACLLVLGQCLFQMKQYPSALEHYEKAIEAISDDDVDTKKKSLYLAGQLSLAMNGLDTAEKHLSALAQLDSSFKDVPALLDKIATIRNTT